MLRARIQDEQNSCLLSFTSWEQEHLERVGTQHSKWIQYGGAPRQEAWIALEELKS